MEAVSHGERCGCLGRTWPERNLFVLTERDVPGGGWKKILSALERLPHPPLLVVTSRLADDHLWAEALNLGAHDVLATPFRATELVWVVENAWHRFSSTFAPKAMTVCASAI